MSSSYPNANERDRGHALLGSASSVTTWAHENKGLREPKLWRPKRVLVTPAALEFAHGRAIVERSAASGAEVVELKANRLTGLGDSDPRRAYIDAKSTLAV